MSHNPTHSPYDDHSFDHPLVNAMGARRQFVTSAILISAFLIIVCVNWLA